MLSEWLKRAHDDRVDRSIQCRVAYNALKDKTTKYAQAMVRMAQAHDDARAVYERHIIQELPLAEAENVLGRSLE